MTLFFIFLQEKEVIGSISLNLSFHQNIPTSIYLYKRDCLYLCHSYKRQLPDQSPPNFARTSPPIQGSLNTTMTPRVLQTPKPYQITGEKLNEI